MQAAFQLRGPAMHNCQRHPSAPPTPKMSFRQFCSRVFLVRHLLVNSSPRHLRGQISGKFQRAVFKQVLPVWLLCHAVSHRCSLSSNGSISALVVEAASYSSYFYIFKKEFSLLLISQSLITPTSCHS